MTEKVCYDSCSLSSHVITAIVELGIMLHVTSPENSKSVEESMIKGNVYTFANLGVDYFMQTVGCVHFAKECVGDQNDEL
ncbi:MAG: hypothetical protein K0T99_02550 [Alphaproteobacteria bacterium]|nr:hypothetical protein [Alphaproteobacteria bacterium]